MDNQQLWLQIIITAMIRTLTTLCLDVIPNQSITFYLDYPDYTGKIQHGCEFQLTDLNNNTNINRIELNQLTVPNSQMECTLNGDPNDKDFRILISSYTGYSGGR